MTASVLVVGSVNIDYLLPVERLPSRGETVVGEELSRVPGGKGANAASAAAALGADTTLIAAIGRDEQGDEAAGALAEAGVECDALQRVDSATGVAIVITDAADENLIAVAPGANRRLDPQRARAAVAERARPESVVLANFEVSEAVVAEVAAQARRQGATLVIDPAPARTMAPELVGACDLLTPNQHEVGLLGFDSAEGLLEMGAGAVAVTLGADGCELHRRHRPPEQIASYPVRVRDTVGAGDAFAAGASVGLAEGLEIEEAVVLGCAAGALASTGAGARGARFDRGEAQALIEGRAGASSPPPPAGPP
jgi:ribokinase